MLVFRMDISQRKAEHVELALDEPAEAGPGPGWVDVHLVHEALPEMDLADVDLSVPLLGRTLAAPLVIAGMTGGHAGAMEINAALARAAERHGLAIGVGSQRAALQDPTLSETYAVVRAEAPTAPVIANLGASQLIRQEGQAELTLDDVNRAIEMVRADALAIHLNFLEESIQPEGDRRTRGCADAIEGLVRHAPVPVVVKETGAGMSRQTVERLLALGIAAVDVGGLGGTNFAVIERMRAERQGDALGVQVGEDLVTWGIPTAVSVADVSGVGLPVIATGGIRSGLDAAKAIALGASVAGVGRPLLVAAQAGDQAVDAWIERFSTTLRTALLLTGSRDVGALRARPCVVTGAVREWLQDLGSR
jgi:isopentenyl-diphosphate delta-isomerase